MAPTLFLSILELEESLFIYNSQKVFWQLVYDQGTVWSTSDKSYSSELVAKNKFVSMGMLQMFSEVEGFLCMKLGHRDWCPGRVRGGKEESLLEIEEPVPIMARDPFLRIKKKIGLTMNNDMVKQTTLTRPWDPEKPASLPPSPQERSGKWCQEIELDCYSPVESKGKGKSVSPYKTRIRATCLCLRWPRRKEDRCCNPLLNWRRRS